MKNRSKYNRQVKAMIKKSIELGFKSLLECKNAGFGNELKKAFENEN